MCVIIINRMGKITKYLNQLIVGSVFDAPEILESYSTDGSALKIKPKFVAFPESTDDICKLMRFFNQIAAKNIPVSVTVRGAGQDTGGADLSTGLVISTEKLNRMLEIDPREKLVRVQAGMTLRELNTALSVSGLTIPIGGHSDDTIGGLISNSPIDTKSAKYGGIMNYVERLEVVLANGECLQTSHMKKYHVAKKAAEKSLEGEIYRKLSRLLYDKTESIASIGKNSRDRSGYPNISKIQYKDTLDLAPLFAGAQGTLGIISEVILRAVPLQKRPFRVIATFKELDSALDYAYTLRALKPSEINFYDLKMIQEARESGKNLDGILRKQENGFVIFARFDERVGSCAKKIASIRSRFPRSTKFVIESQDTRAAINEFENLLLIYLNTPKSGERVPVLTDFYLPSHNLGNFLSDLRILEQKLGLDLALYGSYATSIYSLRPKFQLDDKDYAKKVATFLRAGAYVIDRQGGKLAGGSPEGRLKAVVTNVDMRDSEKAVHTRVKEIFDHNNILNPDIKLGTSSKFTLTHFRTIGLPKIMI